MAVTFLSASQPTFAFVDIRENELFFSSLPLAGFVFSLQLAALKSVSPTASYLFCFAKISNQQKATPDRSKARNKINHLRRWRNSQFASVELLKHPPA
jgi:hypothetical protein